MKKTICAFQVKPYQEFIWGGHNWMRSGLRPGNRQGIFAFRWGNWPPGLSFIGWNAKVKVDDD